MEHFLKTFTLFSFFVSLSLCHNIKLLSENVPVAIGVMLGASESEIGVKCLQDIDLILNGVADRELWALQVLDASGNRQNLFLWANNLWLGSREACLASKTPPPVIVSANTPKLKKLLNVTAPVSVDYRILTGILMSDHQKSLQVLFRDSADFQLGICIPSSCSLSETLTLVQQYFNRGNVSNFHSISVTFNRVKDLNSSTSDLWGNASYRSAMCIFLIITVLTLLSSGGTPLKKSSNGNETKTTYQKFISCFHFSSNYLATMSVNVHPDSVPSVAALKTFSCLWIIGMHVMYFNIITLRFPLASASFDNIGYFLLFRSVLAVDIFFMISGLLVAYNFLRQQGLHRQIRVNSFTENIKLYFRFIIHRYFRLAPVVLISAILSRMVFLYLDSINALPMGFCPGIECEYWYRNILFVQNFYPIQEMCNRWSWHVACDLQLYGIFIAILFIQAKYPRSGRLLVVLVTAVGVLLTFLLCIYYQFQLSVLGVFEAIDTVYTPLWYRIHPYGIGVFIGMIIVMAKNTKMPTISNRSVSLFVICSLTFLISQVLSDAASKGVLHVAFLWSLGRFLFAVFMGSYLCLAEWGYLTPLTKLASNNFCVRINKLSYTLYMFHSVLARLAFGGRLPPSELSYPMIVIAYLGILTATYLFSIICTSAIEVPFQKLTEVFIMKPIRKKEPIHTKKST
ncbi:Acyltransferase 3 domain [Sergentomyia squamirostris]